MNRLELVKRRYENITIDKMDHRQSFLDIQGLLDEIYERDILISDFREQIKNLKIERDRRENEGSPISLLIYSKQFGAVQLVHDIETLKHKLTLIDWAKVEIWKFGTRQNVLESDHVSLAELMDYVSFYKQLRQNDN